MSNKRKGDFTDGDDLNIKQSRQSVTTAEIEEEKTSSLVNTLLTSNDVCFEDSIIRNNISLHNERGESLLLNERKTANKSSADELTTTNGNADEIRVEQIYIPFTRPNIANYNGNINSSSSEVCSLTEIKTEEQITPSPINTYNENVEKSNINDLNRVNCRLDEISVEGTALGDYFESGEDTTTEHNTSGIASKSAEVKVEETEISGSIKRYIEDFQDSIGNIDSLISISQGKNYAKDADDSEKYIDTVNSINRYVKDGL